MIVCTYFIVKSACSYTLCVLCVCVWKQCHPRHRYRWVDICLPLHAFIPFLFFFPFHLVSISGLLTKNGVWIATPTVTTSSFAELHSQVACGKNASHIIQPKLKQTTVKATIAEGLLVEANGSAWRPKINDRDRNITIISNGLCVHSSQVGVSQQVGNTLQLLFQ